MLRRLLILLLLSSSPLWAAEVRELTWNEMIPADAAPQEMQGAPIHDLAKLGDTLSAEMAPAVAQQSPAAPVVKALGGQRVKLPGYVVPLEVTDDGKVTDFLLVPFFGACIHVPPPPSNQIVLVKYPQGVQLDALYEPFWIQGPLEVEAASSELAEAGYQMTAEDVYPYQQAAE
ncbi:DUF3299 domain-containing protein [Pseudomonas sp. N040]|uniref:DUF3299 domain-containing protein n=1 Tax=Pseudomonas sp. N040 TaxID=2785325 RepID=UPI0018A2D99F|nr:DUF3299 domain-containing protein [Pseudomonas sp. N040]MBF7730893.1 DUF3299 domain-containing protein [Pseudomonas sp. N040]MBW7014536.1 DUF3299 domain-containing protein [Pseudomonas sp. N040]